MKEVPLDRGRTTTGVVKVGETVRRPIGQHSDFVHELLTELEEMKFPYSPRLLGIDESGREILTFIEGEVPKDLGEFSLAQKADDFEIDSFFKSIFSAGIFKLGILKKF